MAGNLHLKGMTPEDAVLIAMYLEKIQLGRPLTFTVIEQNFRLSEETLTDALRHLEQKGLIHSEATTKDGKRHTLAKMYTLDPKGEEKLASDENYKLIHEGKEILELVDSSLRTLRRSRSRI